MANTCKAATKSRIDNEPKSSTILDIYATNLATMEKIFMSHLISLQEKINKQCEEIRTLMKENTKLQIVVIENESIKKMIAKLEDKIQEYKRFIRNK